VIIDDEHANRELLAKMLLKHCPSVTLAGTASSAEEAYALIMQTKPQLLFLDVEMQDNTGFDLLRMFDQISFSVIFVSAYNQYAIDAFEFNALGYILKPVDHSKLIKAVTKAEAKIRNSDYKDIIHFIHAMDDKNAFPQKISLHLNDKVHLVDLDEVCYIRGEKGYSEIMLISGQRFVSSKTIGAYEELLSPLDHFLRVNKSMIINIRYVKDYTKGMDCVITIGNNAEVEVSRRKKTSIIRYLKSKLP
jgi:two-component system LytT family response regulator